MKKYLITFIITSIIMLAAMGAVVVWLSKNQDSQSDVMFQQEQEELDLLLEGKNKESISEDEVVMLYREGGMKNVQTFSYKSNKDIYNKENSLEAKEQLEKLQKKNDYDFSTPLWAYNPFGTNPLSLYLYLKTTEPTYLKYTVTVADAAIPDFTRTLYNDEGNNLIKKHEYQLTGLVPGMNNYIVIKLFNQRGQMIKKTTYKLDLSDVKINASTKLATTTGKSTTSLTNGLFYLFGMSDSSKKQGSAIYFYDNSGIMRGVIPLLDYRSDRIQIIDNNMLYSYARNKFAKVTPLGQVIETYSLGEYQQHHDFTYDGFGHLLILATNPNKKSKAIQDIIISLDLKSGKVTKRVDMEKLLPNMVKSAKKEKEKGNLNWIGLNSISLIGTNDIVVSAGELSTIVRINQINSKKPVIQYMISEEAIWEKTDNKDILLEKLILNEEDVYNAQFGQNSVTYEKDSSLSEGQYYLYMFNNNYGDWSTRPNFDWGQFEGIGTKKRIVDNSMYYKYLIDEKDGTYELIKEIKVPYSSSLGSAQIYKSNHVINSGKAARFGEYDGKGKLIREFKGYSKSDFYHVYKYDMKGFWFK